MKLISYNTHDLTNEELTVRVYDENEKIVVYLEQKTGLCFLTFSSEEQYKGFVFELASSFGTSNKEEAK
jgi:hypothetical protein